MSEKSTVAIVKTTPNTVIEDYARLMELINYQDILQKDKTTILKNNISWHLLYPSANTTPWQVEGVTKKLHQDGIHDVCLRRHLQLPCHPAEPGHA